MNVKHKQQRHTFRSILSQTRVRPRPSPPRNFQDSRILMLGYLFRKCELCTLYIHIFSIMQKNVQSIANMQDMMMAMHRHAWYSGNLFCMILDASANNGTSALSRTLCLRSELQLLLQVGILCECLAAV